MKPATFFAIFIPILAIIVNTLIIIARRNKKPDPNLLKFAYSMVAVGLVVLVIILFGEII